MSTILFKPSFKIMDPPTIVEEENYHLQSFHCLALTKQEKWIHRKGFTHLFQEAPTDMYYCHCSSCTVTEWLMNTLFPIIKQKRRDLEGRGLSLFSTKLVAHCAIINSTATSQLTLLSQTKPNYTHWRIHKRWKSAKKES